MFVIPKNPAFPVTITNRNCSYSYNSLEEYLIANYAKWYKSSFKLLADSLIEGPFPQFKDYEFAAFKYYEFFNYHREPVSIQYADGTYVTKSRLCQVFNDLNIGRPDRVYRYSGKRRWKIKVYHEMKTFGAMRDSFHFSEEGEPPVRGARKAKSLPCLWDDHIRSNLDNKNWKRFRKTQYKEKNEFV